MKLTKQLQYTVAGLAGFALLGTITLDIATLTAKSDGTVVNHSGIVRGASQRWVKLELQNSPNPQLADKVGGIIDSLINGSKELNLPKATDPDYLAKMQAVQSDWQALRQQVEGYQQGQTSAAAVLQSSEDFFELTNEAVFLSEDVSVKHVNRERIINLLILALP